MTLKGSPFAWVSFAMIVGVMGTALISPLYPLYKEAWQLQASDISLIYVIYMGGALGGLLFLGRMPDRVGFRRVMQWGMALALLGTLVCMLASNMLSLSVGRFIVGVASSMLMGSSILGLSLLAGTGQAQRAAMLSGFLMAFGFGLGPILGGIVGQWFPSPLFNAHVPTLVLGALGLIALSRLQLPGHATPNHGIALQWRDYLPRLTWPEPSNSRLFILTSCLPFLAFGVFGLYAAMSPLFLDKLVPWHGPVVSGVAIGIILLASGCTQMLAGRLPTYRCAVGGMLGLAIGNALLMANLWTGSAMLFGLGVVFTSVGHGMSMLAGMRMVSLISRPEERAGLFSTYLVIGYLGSMAPMMAIGWIADRWGMSIAVSLFCSLVILTAMVVAFFFQRNPLMHATAD